MPFIDYNTFAKYANPAIVEQVDNSGIFEDYENLAANMVKQITNLSIPTSTADTPQWLVFHIVAVLQKLIANKMQQISDNLRKSIDDDYIASLKALLAYTPNTSNPYTNIVDINGVINRTDNGGTTV